MDESKIRAIWNGFGPDGQNMPYTEFLTEMKVLTSQVGIQKDLADIEMQKARHRTNKIRIDRARRNDGTC